MAREPHNRKVHTRRGLLKDSLTIGSGVVAMNFFQGFGASQTTDFGDDILTILNLAATAETLALTLYYTAITRATFHINEDDTEQLKLVMDAEMHHLQILQALGGKAVAQQFYLPTRTLSDASRFVETGIKAETLFAAIYLAATHQFATLSQPHLAATAAQHVASESQHLTLLSHLAGLRAASPTLPMPLFAHVSDAVPSLKPFLTGGPGFDELVSAPSQEAFSVALDGTLTTRSQSFAQAYNADIHTLATHQPLVARQFG